MSATDPLHAIVYVSQLAPDQGPSAVARIAERARQHNGRHGITGVLVFDGEAFCQWLEGPASQVQPLMTRIRADPRHTGLQVLSNEATARRQFAQFAFGYASADPDGLLHALRSAQGAQAPERLLQWLPQLDALP